MTEAGGSPSLPYVVLHVAVSLDGRTQGFAPNIGAFYGLVRHWQEDATLVGSRTVLDSPEGGNLDDPSSPAAWSESARSERPLLAVVDSGGLVRCWGALGAAGLWKSAVSLGSKRTKPDHLEYLNTQGVQSLIEGEDRVALRPALEQLHQDYGIRVIRVDSGGELNGILLNEGLVSEVSLLVHPVLVGGAETSCWWGTTEGPETNRTTSLALAGHEQVSNELLWVRYHVKPA